MKNLLDELNEYQVLTSNKDKLNTELLSLSGKNDRESINRINEIGANLNQINKSLQGYDKEKLDKVTKYYETKTSRDYELPIKSYEDLTPEEKQKELEDRLQRIFNSSKLPNQGKKKIVTYNGNKYTIPKAYKGRFNETVGELNTIKKGMTPKEPEKAETISKPLTPKETFEVKLDEIYAEPTRTAPTKPSPAASPLEEENPYIYGHYDPKPKPLTLPDLISMCEKNKIKLHPVPTTFRRKHKVDMKKAFTCIKSKVSLERFKKLLPKVWNIDKQVELAFANMNSRLLDKKIVIKEGTVKFAENVIQKYNTAKTHVTNIPKRTKEYIKNKYKDFKNYFREKKEISRLRKEENYSRKEAMEMVYGEKVDKHLDYRIVNRTAKFKENTCQRINTAKGKIVGTTKAVIDAIKKPFDYLRENMKNDTKRQELQAKIEEIRIANRQKEAALKRIKVNSNAGYVGTVALTIISVFALAAIIFMGIGSIINR